MGESEREKEHGVLWEGERQGKGTYTRLCQENRHRSVI